MAPSSATPLSLLNNLKITLSPCLTASRWLLAYSGGVDSRTLLQLLAQWRAEDENIPPIVALHIDHQLHPDSGLWAEHCQQQAQSLGIEILCRKVHVDNSSNNLEDRARKARYQVFESELAENDVLMLGHHLDDQVETFLLRLLRGSGVTGAAAMPQSRVLGGGYLFRPLLEVKRSVLLDYAQQHQLQWVDDPSNTDNHFDRNFLRNTLLPQVAQRWPEYRQTLSRAATLNRQASELNTELAEIDFTLCAGGLGGASLNIEELMALSLARQKNLLRYWLDQRGCSLPSAAQLEAIINEVVQARTDAEPLVCWADFEVRRFDGRLFALPKQAPFDGLVRHPWNSNQPLVIEGVGQLVTQKVIGRGIRPSEQFIVRFRQGGERCTPLGRSGSQTLKKLFQEYRIPPWLRDRVPLIYTADDELVAVGDYWVCEPAAASDDETGLVVDWLRY